MKTISSDEHRNTLSGSRVASQSDSPPAWVCTLYFVLSIFFINFFYQALISTQLSNSSSNSSPQQETVSPSAARQK